MNDNEKILDAHNMAITIIGKFHDDPLIVTTLSSLLFDWKYPSKDKKKTISIAAKRIANLKHKQP